MSRPNSSCAACKQMRQKCTQECVFKPFFPPDKPTRFTNVHRLYGAGNVKKLLNKLDASQREDAVNSIIYEAEARRRDPVYGCLGYISMLKQRISQMETELHNIKKVLSIYQSPQAMQRDSQQQELLEAQQLAAQQQQQQQQRELMLRFGRFEPVGGGSGGWLNQMGGGGGPARLALGNFDNVSLYQIQQQQQGEQQYHHPHIRVPHSHPNDLK